MGYTVQKGDSWARIAGILYGDQRQFQRLMEANSGIGVLHPGMVINTPSYQPNPVVTVDPASIQVEGVGGVNPFSHEGQYYLQGGGSGTGAAAALAALASPAAPVKTVGGVSSSTKISPGSWATQESAGVTTRPITWAEQESVEWHAPFVPKSDVAPAAPSRARGPDERGFRGTFPPYVARHNIVIAQPNVYGTAAWRPTGATPGAALHDAANNLVQLIADTLNSLFPISNTVDIDPTTGAITPHTGPRNSGFGILDPRIAAATAATAAGKTAGPNVAKPGEDRDRQALQLYAFNAEHQDQVFRRFNDYVTPGNPLYGNTQAIPLVVGGHIAEQITEWWRRQYGEQYGASITRALPPDMRDFNNESWSVWDVMTNMFGYSWDPTAIDPVTGRATGAWLRDSFPRPNYTPYAFGGGGGYTTGYGGGGGGGGGYSSRTNAVLHNWNIRIT